MMAQECAADPAALGQGAAAGCPHRAAPGAAAAAVCLRTAAGAAFAGR